MIVMVNGAFGVGKSTVANRLAKAIPNAMLYDPEEVGFMLRSIIPDNFKDEAERTGDFQDLELWRVLTVQVAEEIIRKYHCDLIVPMTIRNKDYFNYIYNGLRSLDQNLFHFCLIASKECIYKRLLERGDEYGCWAFLQTDKCIEAFEGKEFEEKINTEGRAIDDIVAYIITKIVC